MKLENEHLEKITYGFGIAGVLTLVVTTFLFLTNCSFDTAQTLNTVVFNDYGSFLAGSAGLLFNIATTILVYLTYQTQKVELKEAKDEVQASREALELQARTTQLQQFENTFFNLLSNHREVLKSLQETWIRYDSLDEEKTFESKKLIDITVDLIKKIIGGLEIRNPNNVFPESSDLQYDGYIPIILHNSLKQDFDFDFDFDKKASYISELLMISKSKLANPEGLPSIYEKIYKPNRSSLGHYFRNLFHLIKFVDEYKGFNTLNSEPEEIACLKYKYVRLIRAQLSNNELILLALNSITSFGKEFIPFINNYKLLKNVDVFKELFDMEGLIDMFPHFRQPIDIT